MRRALVASALLLAACSAPLEERGAAADDDLSFTELAPGVWLHTAYKDVPPYGPIPTNGLIVASGPGEAVLVDSAWDDAQTARVLAFADGTLGRRVTASVHTHAHDDKMGGVAALRAAGVATFAQGMTNVAAPARGLTPTEHTLRIGDDGTAAPRADLPGLTVFYPGPGHTADNVVVRVEGTDVLFGGCLIRPGGSGSLGNTADADIAHWDRAARAVAARFPDAAIIVPSHGAPGGRTLLEHTAALAEAAPAD